MLLLVDFDVNQALVLTVVGVGTAFFTLTAMVVLTKIMGVYLGAKPVLEGDALPASAAVTPGDVATPEAAPAEAVLAHDPSLVAAVAAAVAVASDEDDGGFFGDEAGMAPEGQGAASGWKSFGRWEIMSSRLSVRLPTPMRRRR